MKYEVTHTNVRKSEIEKSIEAMLHFLDTNKQYDIKFTVVSKGHKKEEDEA